ncbi:hypothetical protein KOI35_21285 [Actinoplanes bogorensis]|uniref:Uncharacterized protein n=1 Tax=Paractinoplanes bogorensis TaxID=1610840 RepID=A0ABS5YSK3_9ACTN|nr:hypothetical protein [Actinoplanes bogorensis]MBU2666051.1 hypothetical protein [Actinoplanes bogorensis]
MNAVSAVDAVSPSSEAKAQLVRYQEKLAADLAAKVAQERVIQQDREAVTKAQESVREAEKASTAAVAGAGLDVTV